MIHSGEGGLQNASIEQGAAFGRSLLDSLNLIDQHSSERRQMLTPAASKNYRGRCARLAPGHGEVATVRDRPPDMPGR